MVSEFVYRIPGKPGTSRPGAHRSNARGPGLAFANYVRLIDQPDPRRLDLRASLRDVNRNWLVRASRQRSATVVQVLVDVSASMRFGSPTPKLSVAADFVESLGYSAFRCGDALGMLAFDQQPRDELTLPARTGRGVGMAMAETLRRLAAEPLDRMPPQALDAPALGASAAAVSHGTSLVFMVSDFHWPLDLLGPVLDQLEAVDLIPVVIWDQAETQPPRAGKWLRTRDLESGRQHDMLMRPSIRRRWTDTVSQRRAAINDAFGAWEIKPVFMEHGFDAECLSRYFLEAGS